MHSNIQGLLTQSELAKRWGRTETAIGLASAVGIGVTRTKVVSPAIDRFRGKPSLFSLFGYNFKSISIDLKL